MIKEIDFSCKHNILIENPDGTFSPMDEPFFESEQIAPGTWKILSDGDFSYLVEGDDEALAIDSGYGCGNIRAYCQSLTQKDVRRIVNTHDHFDHTANNAYFDCAYMSKETQPLATIPFPSFAGIDFPRDYPVQVIGEGDVLHLGGRDLLVFAIPDHAVGSLAFLDSREHILFAGDELGMPMGKPLNGSVERFAGYMEKLNAHRSEFDRIYGGGGYVEASIVERYLANARHILEGFEGEPFAAQAPPTDTVYKNGQVVYQRRFPRPCDLHAPNPADLPFKRVMEYADCRIIYDSRRVREG